MRSLLPFAVAFTACCGTTPPGSAAPALVLGAPSAFSAGDGGGGEFAPLTDGDAVPLVAGAQGGFHVWLSYRLAGVAPGRVDLERLARRVSDGALVLRTSGTVDLAGGGDGDAAIESPAPLPMFMCPTPIGLSVVDSPIRFELRFSAGGTPLVERSVILVPHCPDAARALCERICTG